MNTSRTMQDYRRMAGLGGAGSAFDDWKRERPGLTESTFGGKKSGKVFAKETPMTVGRAKIRRIANLLEDERMGGTLMPEFDPDRIERLMEADASANPHAQAAAHHHWQARFATNQAHEVDKAGDAKASHAHHSNAAEMHRAAAKHLAAAGDVHTARIHDQWAQHHDTHAAHHARAMGNVQHSPHQPAAQQPAGPVAPSKPKKAPKAKVFGRVEKDPFKSHPGSGHAGGALDKLAKLRSGHVAKSEPEHEKHSASAAKAGQVAVGVSQSANVSSHGKAQAFKRASHEHLHAALSAFHAGDHEKALTHFNAAIHHMNKHAKHMDDVSAQGRQAARRAAPAGPRAARGY